MHGQQNIKNSMRLSRNLQPVIQHCISILYSKKSVRNSYLGHINSIHRVQSKKNFVFCEVWGSHNSNVEDSIKPSRMWCCLVRWAFPDFERSYCLHL